MKTSIAEDRDARYSVASTKAFLVVRHYGMRARVLFYEAYMVMILCSEVMAIFDKQELSVEEMALSVLQIMLLVVDSLD